jgi:hypothetical protein
VAIIWAGWICKCGAYALFSTFALVPSLEFALAKFYMSRK